jgi:copper chaperone CopZ
MKEEFKISGIHCNSCISLIKMNIEELDGIKEIKGDEKANTVLVNFDEKITNEKEIIKKIEIDGYKVVAKSKK